MSFSPEWLELREPYDRQARSKSIKERALRWPMSKVIDLGAGTGSTHRALAGDLPPDIHWTLLDHSLELLQKIPGAGTRIEMDLARELPEFNANCLVTASAFMDLVSERWIHRFTQSLNGAAVYSALDVDGHHSVSPEHLDDNWVFEAFRRHQTETDKGFGAALGPNAHFALQESLASNGYTVFSAPSNWLIREKSMATELLTGIASAAGSWSNDEERANCWLSSRLQEDELRVEVGHRDLFGTLL